jgi:hypothetical protein
MGMTQGGAGMTSTLKNRTKNYPLHVERKLAGE